MHRESETHRHVHAILMEYFPLGKTSLGHFKRDTLFVIKVDFFSYE